MRPRHPNKHIEEAVQYAEERGWRVEMSDGHAWGFLLCPQYGAGGERGCEFTVPSTPRVPEHIARRIRRRVYICTHLP
jgi:hypothetical protein